MSHGSGEDRSNHSDAFAIVKDALSLSVQFVFVLQQPQRYSRAERYRSWVHLLAWVLSVATLMSYFYSTVLTWALALLFQLLIVVASSFCLFVLLEYEDRSSDGAEAERLTKPLIQVQLTTRWVQVAHMLMLGQWWFALFFMFPQIPLDWHLVSRQLHVPDATTLWKQVKGLDWWSKVKLVYQGVVFVVELILLVVCLVSYVARGS
jgi:hypothetical protein